jgi:hypothetical protein
LAEDGTASSIPAAIRNCCVRTSLIAPPVRSIARRRLSPHAAARTYRL